MKLAYPDIADMESDDWVILDGRKITKEGYSRSFGKNGVGFIEESLSKHGRTDYDSPFRRH